MVRTTPFEKLKSSKDGRWKREKGGQAAIGKKKKECCKSAGWGRPTLVSGHLWHSHLNRLLQHLHWGQWGKTDGKQSEYGRQKTRLSFNQASNTGSLPDSRLGQGNKQYELEINEHILDMYFNFLISLPRVCIKIKVLRWIGDPAY